MIDEARLDAAMRFLAETDLQYADAKAAVERAEILRKRCRARAFLVATGTAGERNAIAETSGDVQAADDGYVVAVKEYETLRARRQRAELVVDVWRSLEASRRKSA